MSEYIGNRIVPRHDGVWDKAKEYEPLTIVYEESTGDSYMSRKPVPAGTLLSQEEYWAMCSRFSEQMALYRQNTAEEVEQFRKDTAADVEQLRTDTASDVAALRKMTAQDVADITQKVDAANSAVAASKSEMDKTAETLKAQINANVKASTDKNANYAQELVDARVDDEGKTYPTAGDNIRAVGRVRSMQNIMKNWVIKNGYANQNGNLVASESWRVAHMVPVSGDAILVDGQFGYMSGRNDYNNVVCYDMDRKFLGGCFRAESGKVYDNYVITLLPNTRFISVTTNEKLFSKLSVYLYDNMLPLRLLSNYATGWQWMNGSVDIRFTGSKVTVTFPEGKSVYVCRRTNGTQYEQTKLGAENSTSIDFAAKGWWAIYYDGMEVSADETGEKIELPVIKAENTGGDWGGLFTRNRFVFAVLYDGNVVYAAPSNSGTVINGIDYGNPAKAAYNSMTWHKYRSAKMFLATGQFAIDTVNRTIQVTKRILAVVDNGAYYWISASEEPVPMLDSTEAEKHHMLILAYDSSIDQINLYNTAQFRALGVNGYYIAAWYENHFWYPHMGSSFSIVLDGTTYKAGELFDEERRDYYIEKKYEDRFQQLRTDLAGKDSRHMYLASGGITIDQNAGTIQVSTKCLGVPDTFHYEWITAGDPAEMAFNTPSSTFGMPMRILAYDAGTKTINLYDTSLFRKLGTNGFYIASWYQSKLYNPHIHPDVKFIVGGKEYKAGDLFADNAASFIPKRITDYVQKAITPAVEDDIVTPSHWDCMEGRQLSIFFDCLSRHDGKENLYVLARGTNAPSLTRNEYCMNYTPTKDSTDFALTVRRLDEDDCHTVSSKPVQVRVHHKLKDKLTKNICICGDSLVDNGSVATEVYRLLAEDNDCVIHQLGTRGPSGGKHEGRGSWTFARYLADTDWDKVQTMLFEKPRADMTKGPGKKKVKSIKGSPFGNLRCGAILENGPDAGKPCGEGFFRTTYTGVANGYSDERSLKATGEDTGEYLEKYTYSYPVWRCKRKVGERDGEPPKNGSPDQKAYCRSKKGCMSDEEKEAANKRCPSERYHECALEQSFMELLYSMKRDFEQHGDASMIVAMFDNAYEQAVRLANNNSISVQRMATVENQIKEMEERLQDAISHQVAALREAALEQNVELNEALSNGEVTIDDIDLDIRSGLTPGSIGVSFYGTETEEGSEAQIYTELVNDLQERLKTLQQERQTIEEEQGVLAIMKKNFEYFLACLKELPDTNAGGMPLRVNGLDVQGTLLRDVDGNAIEGRKRAITSGKLKLTPERIAEAPDMLHFEKGIYCAFVESGVLQGDVATYKTNFGVTLTSKGNRRTLDSFMGYKRSDMDGNVVYVDAPYKVYGFSIQYRRYLTTAAKREREEAV